MLFGVGLLVAALAVITASGEEAPRLPPRLRDALLELETGNGELREDLAALREYLDLQISTAVATIVANITSFNAPVAAASGSPRGELEQGALHELTAAVSRFSNIFPQACPPVAPVEILVRDQGGSNAISIASLVLTILSYLRSDMGGVFYLIQAWGFNSGRRRWGFLFLASLLSPPLTIITVVGAAVLWVAQGLHSIYTWFRGTALGARLCPQHLGPPPPPEDPELGGSPNPEPAWFRRALWAVFQLAGGPPAAPSPPAAGAAPPPRHRNTATQAGSEDTLVGGGSAGFFGSLFRRFTN